MGDGQKAANHERTGRNWTKHQKFLDENPSLKALVKSFEEAKRTDNPEIQEFAKQLLNEVQALADHVDYNPEFGSEYLQRATLVYQSPINATITFEVKKDVSAQIQIIQISPGELDVYFNNKEWGSSNKELPMAIITELVNTSIKNKENGPYPVSF